MGAGTKSDFLFAESCVNSGRFVNRPYKKQRKLLLHIVILSKAKDPAKRAITRLAGSFVVSLLRMT